MNYYLVDYENVRTAGLNGLSKLDENDAVLIFYTDNADSLTFGLHRRLNESKADIQFQKVESGAPNALDFQLSSYLGYIIREHEGEENTSYYIVSKDVGYAILSNYWKRRHIEINQVMDITGQPVPVKQINQQTNNAPTTAQPKKDALEKELEKLLPNKRYISDIAKIIRENNTSQEINSALMQLFRPSPSHNADMTGIYKIIKPLLTDKL